MGVSYSILHSRSSVFHPWVAKAVLRCSAWSYVSIQYTAGKSRGCTCTSKHIISFSQERLVFWNPTACFQNAAGMRPYIFPQFYLADSFFSVDCMVVFVILRCALGRLVVEKNKIINVCLVTFHENFTFKLLFKCPVMKKICIWVGCYEWISFCFFKFDLRLAKLYFKNKCKRS